MNARRVYILAALLLVLVVAGCNRARNDAQIAGDVVTKINSDANVPTKQITVTSNDGVVTLAGNVTSDAERGAAANDAAHVPGVKTVVNNLQVGATTAAATPAPVEQPAPEATPAPEPPAPKPTARTHRAARTGSQSSSSMTTSSATSAPSTPAVSTPAPSVATAPPPPPPPPKPVTIESGTTLSIRMIDGIDTARNQPGDTFRATLDSPITVDDKVVIPQGAEITGRVAELKNSGHFTGKPELALELTSVSMNGRKYTLHTDQYSREGGSRGKNTAAKVGGGAAVGSIIGAIAGGGKGAAIGGVIGAGAGGGVQAASRGQSVKVPSEALLSFRLESPLTVTPVGSINRTRGSDYRDSSSDYRNNNSTDYSDNSSYSSGPQTVDDNNRPVLKRRNDQQQ
ncbi:MAG: BON domain-containing protein [Acidobacteria bacterium]|nr:BON domain-containing protein [Acidobacteriota bacterium]